MFNFFNKTLNKKLIISAVSNVSLRETFKHLSHENY